MAKGALYGLVALVGVLILLRRSEQFRKRGYWWCLAAVTCIALTAPLVYMWMEANSISFTDALLLRPVWAGSWHIAGSWRVAEGYAMLGGVVVAGLISLMMKPRPNR